MSLASDARCFTCQPEKSLMGMEVYLLGQLLLALNPMANVSPSVLASAAECYTCGVSGKGLLGIQVYLLAQLLEAVGGGSTGGGPILSQPGSDSPGWSGTFNGQTVISTTCAVMWVWDATAAAWVQHTFTTGVYLGLPTVVELRQVDTYTCVPVFATTKGYAAPFDGQARGYDWDPDSTDADGVNGSILPDDRALTGDPGRFKEIGTL